MNPVIMLALLIGAVFVLMFLIASADKRGPSREQRKAYQEAESLLPQGYLHESSGSYDQAASQFGRALYHARLSGDAFAISESLNGLARCQIKRGDCEAAIPLLEEALALEPEWHTPKPNFSQLMRCELNEAKEFSAAK